MNNKHSYILIAIFIITLATRLILAFTIPNFTYESYFHLRQVEHITEHGVPLYHDELSYGGRELRFLPFFHYFMAFFNLFLPLEIVAKIIPNILLASLTLITYLVAKKITNNKNASLFSAFITGFLPILFSTNSFTPETLFLPLTFLTIYAFLNINNKNYLSIYILLFLLLSLTSSATSLLLVGLGIYLLLSLIESKKIDKAELELILFSLFFFIWMQFLFFKNVFLTEGVSFIWQNVPSKIIMEYFPRFSLAEALVMISIIPFLAGIFVVYRALFQLKNKKSFLLISLAISTALLTWLRLIRFKSSLAFFGILLAILFAVFYHDFITALKQTKVFHLRKVFLGIIILLLISSMIYPAVSAAQNQEIPSEEEITAFKWLQENTPETASILASLEEGHLLTYFSKRKNLMDDQFGLIKDVEERYNTLNSLFVTSFQTQAIDLYEKQGLKYVILTSHSKEKYDLKKLKYFSRECFKKMYKQETIIYRIECTIQRTE